MKNVFFVIVTLCTVMLGVMTGCNRDKPEGTGSVPVNLRADIEIKPASTLKVANDQWEANDKVGLFMKRTGQALTASGAVYGAANNVQMSVANNGMLLADPEIMYPETGNVDFIAYHPYTANVGAGFTIPVNVAGQANGLPAEVLYSDNVKNQAETPSAVMLNFTYALAKFELTVRGGKNSKMTDADFAAMTVMIEGLYTQATLQLADGTLTDKREKLPVTLHKKSSNATSATFEAIVIPANETITFRFNVGGVVTSHEMTANFSDAKLFRFNFELDFPDVTLLNTYIVPREEEEIQSISVEVNTNDVYLLKEIHTVSSWGTYIGVFEYDDQNRIIKYGDATLSYNNAGDLVSFVSDDYTETFTRVGNTITVKYDDYYPPDIIELNEEGLPIKWDMGGQIFIYHWDNNGNANQLDDIDAYGDEEVIDNIFSLTFDNMNNPFKNCNTPKWFKIIYFGIDGLWSAGMNNNVLEVRRENGTFEGLFEYTYNSGGYPVTLKQIDRWYYNDELYQEDEYNYTFIYNLESKGTKSALQTPSSSSTVVDALSKRNLNKNILKPLVHRFDGKIIR